MSFSEPIKVIQIQSDADREMLKQNLKKGDWVKVGNFGWDEMACEDCDYDIGVDEYMFELDFCWVQVTGLPTQYTSNCGAVVFEAEGWLWTTCWVVAYEIPHMLQEPSWEL